VTTTAVVGSAGLAVAATLLPHLALTGDDPESDGGTVSLDVIEDPRLPDLTERITRRGSSGVAAGNPARANGGDDTRPAVHLEPASTPTAAPQPRPATISDLAASGIPEVALRAYRSAEATLAKADPGCRLHWSLLAGIGRVESDHGRFGGAVLRTDGRPDPAIIGIPLDGRPGVARIGDSDGGAYDGDTTYDRAVGPMQFIPGTWDMVGADGDGDGTADPQNIYDAALAAGIYLCSGPEDLSARPGQEAAVFRYNHSDSYVALVLALADAYASGTPVDRLPVGVPTSETPTVSDKAPTKPANPGPPGAVRTVDDPKGNGTATPAPGTGTPAPTPTPRPDPTPTPDPGHTPKPSPTTKPTPAPGQTPTPTPDTKAPAKPSGVTVDAAVQGLSASWAANAEPDLLRYDYRVGPALPPEDAAAVEVGKSAAATIPELTPGTRYYVQVRAVDAAGNASPWSDATSAVPTAPGDAVKPTAPTTVAETARTDSTISLEWSGAADTDGEVIGYYVYVDGVRQQQSHLAEASYTVTGLDPETSYAVQVVAVDKAFNQSDRSVEQKFSTAAKGAGS
jgi:chitodextrinase